MTVKELKHMLENAEDNAIVVVRNNWAPAEFLNTVINAAIKAA